MSNQSSLSLHVFRPVDADTICGSMIRDCEIFGTSFLLKQGKSSFKTEKIKIRYACYLYFFPWRRNCMSLLSIFVVNFL